MIFQDGESHMKGDGHWRSTVVLDNSIARKELPVMAAVFVNPGVSIAKLDDGKRFQDNRSVEYDTLSAAYVTFLLDEILPEALKHVNTIGNPHGRGIGGCSSGGISAFTAARQRSDQFRKVLSFSGSFVNLRGGQVYPALILSQKQKPIRVFQLIETNDLVLRGFPLWFEALLATAGELDAKNYDHQFVFGHDTHCGVHGASMLPAAMCAGCGVIIRADLTEHT
jgi:enterochelin esterase family protein